MNEYLEIRSLATETFCPGTEHVAGSSGEPSYQGRRLLNRRVPRFFADVRSMYIVDIYQLDIRSTTYVFIVGVEDVRLRFRKVVNQIGHGQGYRPGHPDDRLASRTEMSLAATP